MRRDDFDTFGKYSIDRSRQPKIVVTIEYDDATLCCTSHDAPLNLEGIILENTLVSVSSTTQKVFPLDGRAEIGGLNIRVLDTYEQARYYDFGRKPENYARSLQFIDPSKKFEISFRCNVEASGGSGQRLVYIEDFVSIMAGTSDRLYIYKHTESAGVSHTALGYLKPNEENRIGFEWDADGNYTVYLNGLSDTGTIANYVQDNCYLQIGEHGSTDELDGWVYDLKLDFDGVPVGRWPCDEGIGYRLHDRFGGHDLVINGISPQSPGWVSQDVLAITPEVRKRLASTVSPTNPGTAITDRRVTLYVGYTNNFDDFVRVQTTYVKEMAYKDSAYEITCADVTRQLRRNIFTKQKTRLAASLTDGTESPYAAVTVVDTNPFRRVWQTGASSDAPNSLVGYIRIVKTGEIIRWTGKATSPIRFTGITRGCFNTEISAVAWDGSQPQEDWPEVEEFIYLEMPAPQMAYALLTGIIYDDSVSPHPQLPAEWCLGIPADRVSIVGFAIIGDDLWDTENGGLVLRFSHLSSVDGKQFIEQEILRLAGLYAPIREDGVITLARVQSMLASSDTVATLTESQIISHGGLKHRAADVVNQYQIDYHWNGEKFLRSELFVDSDSISRNATVNRKVLQFKGLHPARHTVSRIYSLVNTYVDRYRDPPQEISLQLLPMCDQIEAGDVVRVQLGQVQDFAGDGTLDRPFEMQQVAIDWIKGMVTAQAFASSAKKSVPLYVPEYVLADAFFTKVGTNLSSVLTISSGTVTASGSLTGNSNMNANGAVFYYNGDLTIQAGVTLTINSNVQLRIKGTLTVNGDINGIGNGRTGVADGNTLGAAENSSGYPGSAGFIGTTRSGDSLIAQAYNDTVEQASGFTAVGKHSRFPTLVIDPGDQTASPVPSHLIGIPTDLRGSSGGAGRPVIEQPTSVTSSRVVRAKGGTGGNGGAGLCIIARGLAFGASGSIDLSGDPGAAGNSWVFSGIQSGGFTGLPYSNNIKAGTGAGGAPGALLVLIDGPATYPDLGSTFTAEFGAMIPVGWNLPENKTALLAWVFSPEISGFHPDPLDPESDYITGWHTGWSEGNPAFIKNGTDISDACYAVMYIPESIT